MSTPPLSFELLGTDGAARRGRVTTLHGSFETPAFMPVGTRATVKGLMPRDLEETGSQICLANTYHLHVAPGDKTIKKLGQLHTVMGWNKPILTDSGGFQVFSLPKQQLDEEGVTFSFRKGGKRVQLTPERSMRIQNNLGADIIMAFDVCVPYPSDYAPAREAVYRTERWLKRCKTAHDEGQGENPTQSLFGIVQGSTYPDLRALSAQLTRDIELPGYAIGGVSVGEGHGLMMEVVESTEPHLPKDKPRYLMGVGYPEDLIEAVARGVDMFDCVLPSRYGRSGVLFTRRGRIRITKGKYKNDRYPIDPQCSCYACQNFSRGYINHLINSNEILGSVLGTLHNITFYQDLMRATRNAIEQGTFESFRRAFLDEYLSEDRKDELNLHFTNTWQDQEELGWDTEHSVIPSAKPVDPVEPPPAEAAPKTSPKNTPQSAKPRQNPRGGGQGKAQQKTHGGKPRNARGKGRPPKGRGRGKGPSKKK